MREREETNVSPLYPAQHAANDDDGIPLFEPDYPVTDAEAAGVVGPRRVSRREQFRQAWAWHWENNRRFVLLTAITAGSAVIHAAGRLVGVW